MPCYTVQLTTVEFKAQHIDLLKAALKALGLQFTERLRQIKIVGSGVKIDLEQQKVICRTDETSLINRIKQQYSLEAVRMASTKNKWVVKQLANNKLALRRF